MAQTAGEWVAAHAEQPPAALRARLDSILVRREDPAFAAEAVSDALVREGHTLLATILGTGSTQRDAALDLLTADALLTYAFEAAADDPETLDARASAAMRAMSALVKSHTR